MWYNISVSLFLKEIMCSCCVLNELLEPFSHCIKVAAYEFKWDLIERPA